MKMTQKLITSLLVSLAMTLAAMPAASAYSIPADQLQETKIYYGSTEEFEKPANIRYEEIIKATPEYDEVKKDKIERGTGRYWVLLSKASDRANRAIQQVGQETEYDLIALSGYLSTLEPSIPADDITDQVIEAMSAGVDKK